MYNNCIYWLYYLHCIELDFIKMAGQVNDTNDDIVEDREREDRDEEKSDRGFTSSFPSSVELPNEKHNENERKRYISPFLPLPTHTLFPVLI